VLHLHALREKLNAMLEREGRIGHARAAFAYLPDRVRLDLAGFEAMDVFSHD
jgi:ribonuclease D